MNLEDLLGGRKKTITNTSKEKLSHKDSVLKEIENQIRLNSGKDVPTVSMKKNGKVLKDEDGNTKMTPIRSWFNNNTNQFKPTPLGMTFFDGEENSFNVGDSDRGEILRVFKKCIEDGTYQSDLEKWGNRCDNRNKKLRGGK